MSKLDGNVIDPREIIYGTGLKEMIEKLHVGNLPEKEIKRCEKITRKISLMGYLHVDPILLDSPYLPICKNLDTST